MVPASLYHYLPRESIPTWYILSQGLTLSLQGGTIYPEVLNL